MSSGLSIRVPNSHFLTPFVQIGYDGARFYNEPIKEFLFNPTDDQPSTLGRYFFTSAYLIVNHDANSFTMWQGNPSSSSTLVTVMNEQTAEACGNITGVVQQSTAATAATTATSAGLPSSGTTSRVSTGPIVGGVVGGAALLAAIGATAFVLLRRKRRRQAVHEMPSKNRDDQSVMPQEIVREKPEQLVASDFNSPSELNSVRSPSELPPNSRTWEIDGQTNGSFTSASPGAVHEMDGHVYSFRS